MKKILAIAVATAISAPAMADLSIGGNARFSVKDTDGTTAVETNRVGVSITGTSTADSGAYVAATTTLYFSGGNAVAQDDAKLTIGSGSTKLDMGRFEMQKAFSNGEDAFAAATTVTGYENSDVRARDNGNVQLTTVVGDYTVTAGTRIANTDQDAQVGIAGSVSGVNVSAVYDMNNDGADNGIAVTAGTTLEGVAVNASYAKRGSVDSTNINAAYNGFNLAWENVSSGSTDEASVYGAYVIADAMGVAGATLKVGAGSTDTSDVVGVRLDFAF